MSRLNLQLLGPFVATYAAEPLSRFRTRAVQALLIYLACEPGAHPREQLMALLWPETTQASAQNSLRQALYYLRRAIPAVTGGAGSEPEPFVLADRHIIQVNPEALFELDVDTFEQRLAHSREQWSEAIALYRGDFLQDFYMPDSAPFEAWALARRGYLRRQAIGALDVLALREIEQCHYNAAEVFIHRQLAIDDMYEMAHRRLMQILVYQGKRSQALSHYDSYCRLLAEALGADPSAECTSFIERVRRGESGPDAAMVAPPPSRPSRGHNLDAQPLRLIGRQRELAELDALAGAPDRRLINVVGPGGIGKTRLALAFAKRQWEKGKKDGRPFMGDGVFFVSLQPLRNREEMIAAIAHALDLSLDGADPRPAFRQLLDFLREKHLLLVLDNFEHLLHESILLTEILDAAPGLRLLVTSREQLSLYEEQVYPLLGLALPDEPATLQPKHLTNYAAAELFLERARHVLPGYLPSPDETRYLAELCQLVSGIPLALELAASWIDVLSPGQMLAEIREDLNFLAAEFQDLPERHRSMRAVIDSTWSRLPRAEQTILAQLSVFRGGFDAQAAEAVTGADCHTLAALARKSVVQYDVHTRRYWLHELLRQEAECRLLALAPQDGEISLQAATLCRHSAYYCRALAAWEQDLKSKRQLEAITAIETNWDNVRAAWEWAAANGQTDLLAEATDGLAVFIECRGNHHLGEQLFSFATQALSEAPAEGPPRSSEGLLLYGRLLTWLAFFLRDYEQRLRRDALSQKSLKILEALQTENGEARRALANTWRVIAINCRNAWRHHAALQAAMTSMELSQAGQDDWAMAGALEALGRSAIYLRQFEQAEAWLEACLALQRRLGNLAGEARALRWAATAAGSQGEFKKDEQLMRASLAIYEQLGNRRGAARSLANLGADLGLLGDFRKSARLHRESIDRFRHLGIASLAAYQQGALASAEEAQGHYDEAASLAQEALVIARQREVTLVHSLCLRVLSSVAIVQKQYAHAQELLEERDRLLLGSSMGTQIGLACHCYAAIGCENYAQAVRYLRSALLCDDQAAASLLWTLPAGALLLGRLGDIRQALTMYASVSCHPFVGNSRWFDDVVGTVLREQARSLPPRAMLEIENKERDLDIWATAAVLREQVRGWQASGVAPGTA